MPKNEPSIKICDTFVNHFHNFFSGFSLPPLSFFMAEHEESRMIIVPFMFVNGQIIHENIPLS